MVLVGHYPVNASLVGHDVLLVVLVVEYVGLFGLEVGVGKGEPTGVVLGQLFVSDVGVGLLGMKIDFHLVFHGC